jgi:hypothetical protein
MVGGLHRRTGVAGREDGECRRRGRRGQRPVVYSPVSIASVQPVQNGVRAGMSQLPLLWAHGANLQQAPDGQRYGPGAIASGEERFRVRTRIFSGPYGART